ncbi:MAG TPA: hypothetical protein VHD83_29060 [Puia sp.]|nr:hypothetical protein [Puia sp.]
MPQSTFIARTFCLIALCAPFSLRAQQHKTTSEMIPAPRASSVIDDSVKKAFDINSFIFRVYKYTDTSGQYFCVLTESNDSFATTDEGKPDTAHYRIRAVNLRSDNGKMTKVWEINDFILKNGLEISIWWWTRFCLFQDYDDDGLIEPIIIYGTHSTDNIDGNRIKFIIYYKGQKIALRHHDSDLDEGRHTEVDKAFHSLPQKLKDAVKAKMELMNKEGLAIFDKTTF